jgi:23S rRNA pseudouridine1911/1915/1917 synthase
LRVHLASLGHPILGDPTNGGRQVCCVNGFEVPRVMLHARTLGFRHPSTGEFQQYERPSPPDMDLLIRQLEDRLGDGAVRILTEAKRVD